MVQEMELASGVVGSSPPTMLLGHRLSSAVGSASFCIYSPPLLVATSRPGLGAVYPSPEE